MGSSTKNSYIRSKKIIEEEIQKGNISSKGKILGELFAKLLFPKNGASKIKKTLQENLYSTECINSIKNIIKVSKLVKKGDFSIAVIAGMGGISAFSKIEIAEKLCDFLGISNNELLKTSFKETLISEDILDKTNNVIKTITQYVKNIISNVFKQFTYEDTLNALENFNTIEYSNSIEDYMEDQIVPQIELEINELEIDGEINEEEPSFANKIGESFLHILNALRGKKE